MNWPPSWREEARFMLTFAAKIVFTSLAILTAIAIVTIIVHG